MKVLLLEPDFPIPKKSKNHKNFLPIGLLKIASYHELLGNNVILVRGIPKSIDEFVKVIKFTPDEVWITSLFTYWAGYVKKAVQYYKLLFPNSKFRVGGIYASLFPREEVKKYTGCDEVTQGIMEEAEGCPPALHLIQETNPHPLDYQIVHASRGCKRKCDFCGTWKIEPMFEHKKSIKNELIMEKVVFYDNNFLMNDNIHDILDELIELKKMKKIKWCESQSGFDGRLLIKEPDLARKLKEAGFRNVRIAWDGPFKEHRYIKKQLDILNHAGFNYKEIYVFMIFNWIITFEEMEKKRIKCFEWGVQISDCRYRPLDQLVDNYPRLSEKGQTSEDYYIHEKGGWTDTTIRQFRKNIRRQNICIRQRYPLYIKDFEHKKYPTEFLREVKSIDRIKEKKEFLKKNEIVYWDPSRKCGPWKGKLR